MIMKKIIYIATIGITLLTTSCDDFFGPSGSSGYCDR